MYAVFHSIWKNLHLTENFTQAPPEVPVTNMRYGFLNFFLFKCIQSLPARMMHYETCNGLNYILCIFKCFLKSLAQTKFIITFVSFVSNLLTF